MAVLLSRVEEVRWARRRCSAVDAEQAAVIRNELHMAQAAPADVAAARVAALFLGGRRAVTPRRLPLGNRAAVELPRSMLLAAYMGSLSLKMLVAKLDLALFHSDSKQPLGANKCVGRPRSKKQSCLALTLKVHARRSTRKGLLNNYSRPPLCVVGNTLQNTSLRKPK